MSADLILAVALALTVATCVWQVISLYPVAKLLAPFAWAAALFLVLALLLTLTPLSRDAGLLGFLFIETPLVVMALGIVSSLKKSLEALLVGAREDDPAALINAAVASLSAPPKSGRARSAPPLRLQD